MARMVCVNGVCVPVTEEVQTVLDPHELAGDLGHLDALKVSLVSFKKHDRMSWLIKALDLPGCLWWRSNHDKSSLLAEILTLLRGARPSKGRMPKMPTALAPLKIRGRVLWFQNNPRCVVLGLVDPDNYEEAPAQDTGVADLAWFLQEFMKDFQHAEPGDQQPAEETELPDPQDEPAEPDDSESEQLVEVPEEHGTAAEPGPEAQKRTGGPPRKSTPKWAQTEVELTLKELGALTECKSVVWSAARRSFHVVRLSDNSKKEFILKGLKRTWDEAQERNTDAKIQDAFGKAMSLAMSFLREELAAPLADAPAPLADAPAAPDAHPVADAHEGGL